MTSWTDGRREIARKRDGSLSDAPHENRYRVDSNKDDIADFCITKAGVTTGYRIPQKDLGQALVNSSNYAMYWAGSHS